MGAGFQIDVTVDGRQGRFLNIVDAFVRESLAAPAFRSRTSDRTTRESDRIISRAVLRVCVLLGVRVLGDS